VGKELEEVAHEVVIARIAVQLLVEEEVQNLIIGIRRLSGDSSPRSG
jgi:hypothetical protein